MSQRPSTGPVQSFEELRRLWSWKATTRRKARARAAAGADIPENTADDQGAKVSSSSCQRLALIQIVLQDSRAPH